MTGKPLTDQVALVAGATRGAGRAIAVELGRAGATVYCTGRSVRGRPSSSGRPETIEETAERVTAAGGHGIWRQVDHTDEAQVIALCAAIRADHGRLNILINDIWGGDELAQWTRRFWEVDIAQGFTLLERAVHTHIITSRHAVPLMLPQECGLIVEVTDGDNLAYRGTLFYDLAKTSTMRLAKIMANDLRETAITAVAVTPGFLRSEAMLDHFGVTEADWRDAIAADPHFVASETPHYVARAIVALASDPDARRWNGQTLASWKLAKEYGFTDLDGTQPDWGAYFAANVAHTVDWQVY